MQIASSPTRDKYPLSPKKVIKKTLNGTIVGIIALIAILGVYLFFMFSLNNPNLADKQTNILGQYLGLAVTLIFGLGLISVISNYFYQSWYFAKYFYDLTPDYVIIKKGVITPREINVPYERIQDVYVDQDIFDRLFGLYDVHISSATYASGWFAHIDGVEKAAADGLRQLILETVSKKLGKPLPQNQPQNQNEHPGN